MAPNDGRTHSGIVNHLIKSGELRKKYDNSSWIGKIKMRLNGYKESFIIIKGPTFRFDLD